MTATSGKAGAPAGIVPRWEWRTFGDRVDAADDIVDGRTPDREQSSQELYLLSVHSDASVKVRDGSMDVKQLLRVDDEGLEQWMPVLKSGFPLSREDASSVIAALGLDGAEPARPSYSLDELIDELIGPDPGARTVEVGKRRTQYDVGDCIVELTELTAGGTGTHTFSIESPDPSSVSAMRRRLGLADRANVSVARGLKALVGFGIRRHAVIDVGTNSVKFHVGERHADGTLRTVVDRAHMTRLGEGQDDAGMLTPEAIARTVEVITALAAEARQAGPVDIVVVGTAGLRRAPNRAELLDAARTQAGVTVEVLSGDDEARVAYLAATASLGQVQGRLIVFDSGGGSTQFTFGREGDIEEQFSVDVGAVRVAERFGLDAAVSAESLEATLAALASDLHRLDDRPRPEAIVAIGGTATNLASVQHGLVEYDPDLVHGTVLDIEELDRQIELYRTRNANERRQVVGLQPARAEVILAGACIVRTILTKLQHRSMTVSDRGLRHGVVIERFSG